MLDYWNDQWITAWSMLDDIKSMSMPTHFILYSWHCHWQTNINIGGWNENNFFESRRWQEWMINWVCF